ncbi:hypothetical protein LTR22_010306, partial [Elasticomyces elasticus]
GNGGFKVLMLNRKSLDNFQAEMTSVDNVEITPELLGQMWVMDVRGWGGREYQILGCALQAEIARGGDSAGGGEGMVEDVGKEEEVEEGYSIDGTTEM